MPIPASPSELTADWLASVLDRQGVAPGERASPSTQNQLGGEQGMTGRLVRLRLRYQDGRPGRPETLIAKFSAAEPAARAVISALGHYEREVRFYESLSSRTPVPTPHCYYSHLDTHTGFALLVLEDLAHAHNRNTVAGCTVEEAARVLATLARMHANLVASRRLGQRHVATPAVPARTRSHGRRVQPGMAVLHAEVEYPRNPPDQRDGELDPHRTFRQPRPPCSSQALGH